MIRPVMSGNADRLLMRRSKSSRYVLSGCFRFKQDVQQCLYITDVHVQGHKGGSSELVEQTFPSQEVQLRVQLQRAIDEQR